MLTSTNESDILLDEVFDWHVRNKVINRVRIVTALPRKAVIDLNEELGHLAEYHGIGVREYWIIDRFQRIMTICPNRPERVASLVTKDAETYRTNLLSGFTLAIAHRLARADDWPR